MPRINDDTYAEDSSWHAHLETPDTTSWLQLYMSCARAAAAPLTPCEVEDEEEGLCVDLELDADE